MTSGPSFMYSNGVVKRLPDLRPRCSSNKVGAGLRNPAPTRRLPPRRPRADSVGERVGPAEVAGGHQDQSRVELLRFLRSHGCASRMWWESVDRRRDQYGLSRLRRSSAVLMPASSTPSDSVGSVTARASCRLPTRSVNNPVALLQAVDGSSGDR